MEPTKQEKIIVVGILIAFAIAFIVLVAEIAMIMAPPNYGSPESTFRELIGGMNENSMRRLYDSSIYRLNMTYEDFADKMGDFMGSRDYDIDIEQVDVISSTEFTPSQTDEMESIVPYLEHAAGSQLEDYALIDFVLNVTITEDGTSDTGEETGTWVCVKVDSRWYVVFPPIEESTPTMSLSKMIVTGGVKISVLSITDTDVEWSDVLIVLEDNSSYVTWNPNTFDLDGGIAITANYSERMLGPILVCCNVVDLAGNGRVNGADFVTLTTYDGSPTYSSGTIYTIRLIYEPTGHEMGSIQFTG